VKRAIITGVTGQDGSYLAELLLKHNYEVHGLVRRSSNTVRLRLDHLTSNTEIYGRTFCLHYADLDDTTTIRRLIHELKPDEIYHLAAQSHVGVSFEIPESTCEFIAMGTLRLLEIVRDCQPMPKVLLPSSSEIFGQPDSSPQNEMTSMRPTNPYGAAKAFATNMMRIYRDRYGIFACNAICYNHESPRRGESFVTRKITRAAARIKLGLQSELVLGNLDSQRDWGFAPDYVAMFWKMMQQCQPEDYVLATGQLHSVQDWLEQAFRSVSLDWPRHVRQDPKFMRPSEPSQLVGDASRARKLLGFKPSLDFSTMVQTMVHEELALATTGAK
jgi:GDPmannose 4,6-dehydratase